jgi:Xaa-Pro aminopeptidase
VYTATASVQTYAYSLLKPGVTLREYEQLVRERMNSELVALGLTTGGIKQASVRYFPHLASHFLGLDVHDSGNYDTPLQENMILTVEPGIYIPEESIGVRIEDNVLVTKTGIRVMSKNIPTDLIY